MTHPKGHTEDILGIRCQALGLYLQLKLKVIEVAIELKLPAPAGGFVTGDVGGNKRDAGHGVTWALAQDEFGLNVSVSLYRWRSGDGEYQAGQQG